MSNILVPRATYERIFSSILGTAEDVEAFRSNLTDSLATPSRLRHRSPYSRLSRGLFNALTTAVKKETPVDNERQVILSNAEIGIKLAVASLRTVGDMYTERAVVAQRKSVVERSVKASNNYVLAGSYTDAITTMRNMSALKAGVDPAPNANFLPILGMATFILLTGDPRKFSQRSYDTKTDHQGQVSVQPRFARVLPDPDNVKHCPASEIRVPGNEYVGTQALAGFIGVASGVAIEEIYPRYFEIVDEKPLISQE